MLGQILFLVKQSYGLVLWWCGTAAKPCLGHWHPYQCWLETWVGLLALVSEGEVAANSDSRPTLERAL